MFEKIYETYGIRFGDSGEKHFNGIPIYMTAGRKFNEIQFEGQSFLAVDMPDDDRFGSIALGKQLSIYQSMAGMPVAYHFTKMTKAQSAALVKRHIPYICEPDMVFLPFLGVMMRNSLKKNRNDFMDKMMPAAQNLFLYLLYGKKDGTLKKDAADELELTRTSISRASAQLAEYGLITEEKKGKEIMMSPVCRGIELFEKARPYLINPVRKTIYVNDNIIGAYLSGESALGDKTMLTKPDIPVYALFAKDDFLNTVEIVDPRWKESCSVKKIEIWKYNPSKFAKDGVVDPVSLAMSVKDQEDERIEDALEEYMEKWEW